ncbi:MAG: hypothetical protein WCA46_28145, partial [Actinocatenispora sp.]
DSLFDPKLTPISIGQAVTMYRQHPGRLHPDITLPKSAMPPFPRSSKLAGFTPPAPGVYAYTTSGKDWIKYDGQNYNRKFPSVTPMTVRRGTGCIWELAFQGGKQYTDGHVQCSTKGEFLCLAHLQHITFGNVHRAMTHRCAPAMSQVAGKADHPGGVEKTVCKAGPHEPSHISTEFKGTEKVDVGGQTRTAYHVVLDSTIEGDVVGTAVAEVWFDSQTGMYLRMLRTADAHVDLPGGGKAYYHARLTYRLRSMTPKA